MIDIKSPNVLVVCLSVALFGCNTVNDDESSATNTSVPDSAAAALQTLFDGAKSGTITSEAFRQIDALNPVLDSGFDVATVPTTGSATLNGIIEISTVVENGATEAYAGNTSLLLEFDNADVTVSADGFSTISKATNSLTGSTTGEFAGTGKIFPSSSTLELTLSGAIQGQDTYTFDDISADANLFDNASGNIATVGKLTGEGSDSDNTKVDITGGFFATNQ